MMWRIESREDQDSQGAVQWASVDPSVGEQFAQTGETADRLKAGEATDSMEPDDLIGANGTFPLHGGHFTPFSGPLAIVYNRQAQRVHRGDIETNFWRPCVSGTAPAETLTSAEDSQRIAAKG